MPDAAAADAATLTAELDWLNTHADSAGPFYCGAAFSIADAALVPFFLRMFELQARVGFEIPGRCDRLIKWYAAVVERPSVIASLETPEEGLDYEAGGGGGNMAGVGGALAGGAWWSALPPDANAPRPRTALPHPPGGPGQVLLHLPGTPPRDSGREGGGRGVRVGRAGWVGPGAPVPPGLCKPGGGWWRGALL